MFTPELVGTLLGIGDLAVLMGFCDESCGLWVPATAYILGGFPGGVFHALKFVAGRARVVS